MVIYKAIIVINSINVICIYCNIYRYLELVKELFIYFLKGLRLYGLV